MFPPLIASRRPQKRSFAALVRDAVDTALEFATLGEATSQGFLVEPAAAPSLRVEQAWSTPLGPVLRLSQLRRSAVVFLVIAAGSSLLGSFLPTAATSLDPETVAAALLLFTGTATVARWYTGRLADRVGATRGDRPHIGDRVVLRLRRLDHRPAAAGPGLR